MQQKLYYEDMCPCKIQATVIKLDSEKGICLDLNILFPQSSSEVGDLGTMENTVIKACIDEERTIWHIPVEENIATFVSRFNVGDNVSIVLDTNRRAYITTHHTALHLLSSVMDEQSQVRAIAGQVRDTESHLVMRDVIDEQIVYDAVDSANQRILTGGTVKTFEGDKREGFRLCEIEGLAYIPCGGIHVYNLKDIGSIVIDRIYVKKKKTYIQISTKGGIYNGAR